MCRIPPAALPLKIHPALLNISVVFEFIQNYYKKRPINNVLKYQTAHTKRQRVTYQFVSWKQKKVSFIVAKTAVLCEWLAETAAGLSSATQHNGALKNRSVISFSSDEHCFRISTLYTHSTYRGLRNRIFVKILSNRRLRNFNSKMSCLDKHTVMSRLTWMWNKHHRHCHRFWHLDFS